MENENYNVIVVRCKKTGKQYIATRKEAEGIKSYQAKIRAGLKRVTEGGSLFVHSVRDHGLENHTFRIDSVHPSKEAALQRKVELVIENHKGRSIVMNMPSFSDHWAPVRQASK